MQLHYPCLWQYKLIGLEQMALEQAIHEVVCTPCVTVTVSNKSRSGKYCCLNLELEVESEAERDSIYQALKKHPAITMVL